MKHQKKQDLLTVAEVATLLKKSPSTIRRWHNKGRIPGGFKLDPKSIRFVAKEITDWIQKKNQQK